MPLEWQYADDCDFIDEDMEQLRQVEEYAKQILPQWNLIVNETKTEYVKVSLASKTEKDDQDKPLINNEPWRSSKSLGSLLCSEKYIISRCIKGEVSLRKFEKVWLTRKKILLDRKLRLYEAQVVSVMLYNSNSWSATKTSLKKLDVTHRRHLRRIEPILTTVYMFKVSDIRSF